MKIPAIGRNHVGVIGAGLALGLWSASLAGLFGVEEQYSRFRPIEGQGYAFTRYLEPTGSPWHGVGLVFAGGTLIGLLTVPVDGRPLLEVDRLDRDVPETLQILGVYCSWGIGSGAKWLLTGATTASGKASKTVWVKVIPLDLRSKVERKATQWDWLGNWKQSRRLRIGGTPGSGKSYLTRFLLHEFASAGYRIYIADINFGKPERDRSSGAILKGKINDWQGFPPAAIAADIDGICELVRKIREELDQRKTEYQAAARDRRKPQADTTEIRLILDELDSTIAEADALNAGKKEPHNTLRADLNAIASQGDGYGIGVVLVGQSLAVGKSGINEATNAMFSIALLGENCDNSAEVSKLKTADAKALIEEARQFQKRGKYAAIVQLPKRSTVAVTVPDLSWVDKVRYAADGTQADPDDPAAVWWSEVFTPQFERRATEAVRRHLRGDASSPRKSLAAEIGLSRLGNDDPRYSRFFAPWYQGLIDRLQKAEEQP